MTVLAVTLFVTAGNWQRGRLAQKEAIAATYERARVAPPMPIPDDVQDWGALRYRNVDVEGHYDATAQLWLDNRVEAGRVGYHVLTPLRMNDGRNVLVNRGFVPAGATRAEVPVAPPPAGAVSVRGRIMLPPAAYLELDSGTENAGTTQKRLWQNLDVARMSRALQLPLLPIVIEQTSPADDGLVRRWPAPDHGADKHRVYMVQWYVFAALAAGLYIGFAMRRRLR